MLEKLKKYWPIIFIFVLWFAFSSPYFIKGKVPFSSTYLVNFFPPWSYYSQFWGPIKNNAMPDVNSQIYPWRKLAIDSYKQGQIPLWNPYSFSGNPLLANYQSAVFSPFNILFFILPFINAWSLLVLLQPILAGVFMYIFLRQLVVSKAGSLLGSIAFMFCGFMVVWMAYGTLPMAIAFLPLALFAIEKYSQTKEKKFLFLLVLTIPFSFFSGHFQMSFYFLLTIFSYVLFKAIQTKNLYAIRYTLSAVFFGLLLSLPQIMPSIQFYDNSVRSEIFISGGGIPFYYLPTIFAPDFFGNPVTRNDWYGFYAEWSSFIGVIPFILVCTAFLGKKKRSTLFFIVFSLFTLLLVIDSPMQQMLGMLKLPVISTSAPNRIIVLLSFSLAVLAGIGFDTLKDLLDKRSIKKIMAPFLIIGLLLLFIWFLLLSGKIMTPEHLSIAKRNFILPTVLFVGAALLIFASMFTRWKTLLLLTTYYLLFTTSFDSLRFAQKWMPFDPPNLMYPRVTIIDAIQKYIGDGRLFGNFGSELSVMYKIPSIEGYDPLYIGRYGEFIRSASDGQFILGERSVVKMPRIGSYTDRALDILGVTLIFHPIADTNQGWAYPVWEDTKRYSLVYKDDKFQLFKNNQAMPRASLFYNVETIKNNKDIIKRFYSADFDFRKIVILEESIEHALEEGTGSAKMVLYTPNKITIEAETTQPAILFLSDNFYPGWKATVNGKKTKIYRADYTFRAIEVPAGKSNVEFIYEGWNF